MGGGPMTVKQTATELTIETTGARTGVTTIYKLDGSESQDHDGSDGKPRSTAKWDGSKLVITTKAGQDGT